MSSPVNIRRTTGGRFGPGSRANPHGRPIGVPNKASLEIRAAAQSLVGDKRYRAALRKRLIAGTLPAAVECLLFYYAYGKPLERLQVEGVLSLEELLSPTWDAHDRTSA